MRIISKIVIILIITSLLPLSAYGSSRSRTFVGSSEEKTVTSFVGRWKDKPFGAETMTFDLLADKSGDLSLLGEIYHVEWEVNDTFSNDVLGMETADLQLFLNGKEMGTAKYCNLPESLSLNINGNEFIFLYREDLSDTSDGNEMM